MRYVIIPLVIILYIALTIRSINDILKVKRERETDLSYIHRYLSFSDEIELTTMIWIITTVIIIASILVFLSIKYW